MYNKLFTKILDSSIWLEPAATRLVWLTFIAAMDENGFVQFASVANLAHRARVSIEEAQSAVDCLEAEDVNSSDPENGGKRAERVPGGWMVLNAGKYRDMVTRAIIQEQTRLRVAKHRKEKKAGCNAPVTHANASVTQSRAESDTETESEPKAKADEKAEPKKQKPKNNNNIPQSETAKRLAALFHRRETTPWSEKEIDAFKALGKIEEEDLNLLERYFATRDPYLRKDLGTLLNNFAGELDRARAKLPRIRTTTPPTDPEGWREWMAQKGYEYAEFSKARGYMKEEFSREKRK